VRVLEESERLSESVSVDENAREVKEREGG